MTQSTLIRNIQAKFLPPKKPLQILNDINNFNGDHYSVEVSIMAIKQLKDYC